MKVLGQLTEGELSGQRSRLKKKILQFGEGNFLRAFVEWMVYTMNSRTEFSAAVTIIQPIERGLVEKLQAQDGLYNLYLNGFQNGEYMNSRDLINVVQNCINPYTNFEGYMGQAANPDLRFIISNTTEAGIQFNPDDSSEDRPASSFPGKLAQLLFRRYQELPDSDKLFILPCELIDKNGMKLNEAVLKYAEHWGFEPGFNKWLFEKANFYNTLVDRIVPGYPNERAEKYWRELGYKDELIVEAEIFHLWVIEGPDEIKEKLPTQAADLNVVFTDNLDKYRTRKVRILNGAHTCLVPVAYLYGLDTVRESVENQLIGSFIRSAITEEIIPSLDGEKSELQAYADEVIDRFKNPAIQHELITISLNSFSKFKTRVLPSILGYYKNEGKLPTFLMTSLAALLYFYRGKRFNQNIELKDEPKILDLLRALWSALSTEPKDIEKLVNEVLANKELWEQDLNEIPGFSELVSRQVYNIHNQGMGKVVQSLL